MARQWWTLVVLSGIVLTATSCTWPEAGRTAPGPVAHRAAGPWLELRVELVDPEDAAEQGIYPEVFVDDRPVGNFNRRGVFEVRLPRGSHVIRVREPGFEDWEQGIDLTVPGSYFLAVQLQPARGPGEEGPRAETPAPAEAAP